ncbi:MAG: 1-acyl-sn-glycerol-3-phosphate acyltransferase [Microcoleaceae cyanobacterium]
MATSSSLPDRSDPVNSGLPTLTDATIARVKEGLEAARSPQVMAMIDNALTHAEAVGLGQSYVHFSGGFRRFVIRSLVRALFRIRVENLDLLPNKPTILAANHLSHIDPFLLLSEIPSNPYYYILGDARSLYNKAWKRSLLKMAGGTIPIQRIWKEELAVIEAANAGRVCLKSLARDIEQDIPTGTSVQALRRLDRIVQGLLQQDRGLIIFPEGRLGCQEGKLCLPLKRGTMIYALRSGIPIVPVGIIGTNNLYFRKQLTIRLGQPLIFPQTSRPKPQDIRTASEALQQAMVDLLPQHYHEPDEIQLFSHFLNHMLW